ncbi:hypothetical protein RWF45_003849 [Salmonella enterica]|nr:hypothetical protein [Salmonella enterica]ELL0184689.1 hypothetical protein [Salmonella enterica]
MLSVLFDSGAVIKCGFSHLVQHYDKFNLNIQCVFVIENISRIKIYAENDVEFNTDHPTYAERVVFRLKNCKECEFSGFNFNPSLSDYSIKESDKVIRQEEWWKGFTVEECDKLEITKHWVNACHVFVMADSTNLPENKWNGAIGLRKCRFKYVVNYCIITRCITKMDFTSNKVEYQGRAWHTYGEAVAPTTKTKNFVVHNNEFINQIAIQSSITPGPQVESGLITDNYCRRTHGMFLELGSSSNLIISNNISISTGEVAETTHILLVGEVDDQPLGEPHHNILIDGNMFIGGGYAIQEYNTGIPLRTGFSILNNHMYKCMMPIITNQPIIYRDTC